MKEQSPLFVVTIDSTTKDHLSEVAKWARIFAIAGFIFLGVIITSGVITTLRLNDVEKSYRDQLSTNESALQNKMTTTAIITYGIIAVLWFFPLFYLLRFSNNMKAAIAADNKVRLDISFQYLKVCFRYLGIITIIGLVIYGISLFIGVAIRAGIN